MRVEPEMAETSGRNCAIKGGLRRSDGGKPNGQRLRLRSATPRQGRNLSRPCIWSPLFSATFLARPMADCFCYAFPEGGRGVSATSENTPAPLPENAFLGREAVQTV